MPWSLRRADGSAVEILDVVTIGRDPACDLMVDDREVSRIQCRISVGERSPLLENVSKYGTLVNGDLVEGEFELGDGDRIEVGGEEFAVARPRRTAFFAGEGGEGDPSLPRYGPYAPRDVGAYAVDLVEVGDAGRALRFHDAVAVEGVGCLLVLLEVAGDAREGLLQELGVRCRELVRAAAKRGATPGEVLAQLHVAVIRAGTKGRASAARADLRNDVVVVACAGPTSPFVVRSAGRAARVQLPPTLDLGTGRAMAFEDRVAHFDRGDALLLVTDSAATALEGAFAEEVPEVGKLTTWLRKRLPEEGAAVLCVTRT